MSSSSSSCTEEAITEIPEIIVDPVDEREVRALVAPNINYRSDCISSPSKLLAHCCTIFLCHLDLEI